MSKRKEYKAPVTVSDRITVLKQGFRVIWINYYERYDKAVTEHFNEASICCKTNATSTVTETRNIFIRDDLLRYAMRLRLRYQH
jgi:hypothetical protein